MAKQNLTPDGVADKIKEVYALPTVDRLAEAVAIETGFKTWVSDNFNLDSTQVAYLTGMDSTVSANYGANCAIAFRDKLGIALITPTPRDHSTKWLKLNNNIVMATNGTGAKQATGSLTFEIEYRD
uniref:hypothetical protein n=1 Tax=Pedobacter schmidteae TaxID=2201271 RepID=UPI000EB1B782|nr:hypothetical protein [Pedobacter schmidteae]